MARNHHTVPQFQLRPFAAGSSLCVHHRCGRIGRTTVKRASAQLDFYSPDPCTGPDDRVETWLARRVEDPAVATMHAMRRGAIPSDSDRRAAATFIAFAMVRGETLRRTLCEVSRYVSPMVWAMEAVSSYRRRHPDVTISDNQAADLVQRLMTLAPDEVTRSDPASDMRNMIREADRLQPLLVAADWQILSAPKRLLITSDTPVAAVHPLFGPAPGPALWPDDHDLYMPVTPKALLVVSRRAELASSITLTDDLAARVNEALARSCHDSVMHHPDMRCADSPVLTRRPPPLPTPRRTVTPIGNGKAAEPPNWPQLVTAVAAEGIALLGSDPVL